MRSFNHHILKCLFSLVLLTVCSATTPSCTSRRCLAKMLIDGSVISQPQVPNCNHKVRVPLITYQTLSVDTKNLQFTSKLKIAMEWSDPDLAWNTSVYNYSKVVLPVDKFWTPDLSVSNAVTTDMRPGSKDLLVYSNGTIDHTVYLMTVVGCEVNLLRYPYAFDSCPIALNAWSLNACGVLLMFEDVDLTGADGGDWITNTVTIDTNSTSRDDRNFLWVSIELRSFNPFVSLLLPSILVILADVVSFALPLGGGERISFKITLVLSFIMFITILNNLLPGDGQCSPIIRYHFCVCLNFLVLSLLHSMLLTRLAKSGTLLPFCLPKWSKSKIAPLEDMDDEEERDEESKSNISVIKLKAQEHESATLEKVVNFLENMEARDKKIERFQGFANKVDKICFLIYFTVIIIYTAVIIYMYTGYSCNINHFDFWDDEAMSNLTLFS